MLHEARVCREHKRRLHERIAARVILPSGRAAPQQSETGRHVAAETVSGDHQTVTGILLESSHDGRFDCAVRLGQICCRVEDLTVNAPLATSELDVINSHVKSTKTSERPSVPRHASTTAL